MNYRGLDAHAAILKPVRILAAARAGFLGFAVFCAALFLVVELAAGQGLQQGVESLASELTKLAPTAVPRTVVVADFADLQGSTCDLGRFVAERLTTRLSRTPGFQVVERRRLNQILTELALGMDGLVDPKKAKQVGRMLGATGLLAGTVSDLGGNVDLDARIIEIETGNVLPGASATVAKDTVVAELLKRGCTPAASPLHPSPPDPAASSKAPSRNQTVRSGTADGYLFQLNQCTASDTAVVCDIVITNQIDDRPFGWDFRDFTIVDNNGLGHPGTSISFDNKPNGTNFLLLSGIPAPGKLEFRGDFRESKRIAIFEKWRGFKFRDVYLAR